MGLFCRGCSQPLVVLFGLREMSELYKMDQLAQIAVTNRDFMSTRLTPVAIKCDRFRRSIPTGRHSRTSVAAASSTDRSASREKKSFGRRQQLVSPRCP